MFVAYVLKNRFHAKRLALYLCACTNVHFGVVLLHLTCFESKLFHSWNTVFAQPSMCQVKTTLTMHACPCVCKRYVCICTRHSRYGPGVALDYVLSWLLFLCHRLHTQVCLVLWVWILLRGVSWACLQNVVCVCVPVCACHIYLVTCHEFFH